MDKIKYILGIIIISMGLISGCNKYNSKENNNIKIVQINNRENTGLNTKNKNLTKASKSTLSKDIEENEEEILEVVVCKDENFESAIRQILNKYDGDISTDDISGLKQLMILGLNDMKIRDITFLKI